MGSPQSAALDFGFGFNDPKHSNKIIRIVIVPDDSSSSISKPGANNDNGTEPPASIKRLRTSAISPSDGNGASPSSEKCIHVSSLILAAHSPFFEKLFSNGMRESGEQHVTLHIRASEEAAVVELLKFCYTGTLSSNAPPALIDVMIAADKFEVLSCVNFCGRLLLDLPMTVESALRYLDLDSTTYTPMVVTLGPLTDAATMFIAEHFNHLQSIELQEELFKLPLVGVEAVLSSDYLQVESEDDIYDFMLKWVQSNYSEQLEERRRILNTFVHRFLRFPFLSTKKLESILACSDIDPIIASELALGTVRYYKAQPQQHQHSPDKFRKRAYTKLPLKAVVADSSSCHPHCVIYVDLKRDDFENVLPRVQVKSQSFLVGEHQLSLNVWQEKNQNGIYCLGLYFTSSMASKTAFNIYSDIVSMDKSSGEFVRRLKDTFTMSRGNRTTGWSDVFQVPWTTFISKDSPYFINGVLLLRCDLTIKN